MIDNRTLRPPVLFAFTDEDRGVSGFDLLAHLPRNSVIISRFRHADKHRAEICALCRKAHAQGIRVILAAPAAHARRLPVDGIHIPERQLRRMPGPCRVRPGWLVTASAHNMEAVIRADTYKLDAVFFSPVLPTPSHPCAVTLGIVRFSRAVRTVRTRVVPLGGISDATLPRLRHSGAGGIAGIGLFSDQDPVRFSVFRQFWARLSRDRPL